MARVYALLWVAASASVFVHGGPVATAALSNAQIDLEAVDTFDQPIAMAVRSGDPALYFAEKGGRVVELEGGTKTTVLDISDETSGGGEQGLLGIAFSPSGDALFVNFTNTTGDTVVRRYAFTEDQLVDENTASLVITIDQPFENHNGGNIAFGPDGYLYIGMGDGGSQDDPANNAQDITKLLGKMLRIDPLPAGGYQNPPDNPYVGRRGKDQVWARGLRNPWRWSFDDVGDGATDDLWIGDVGGQRREEIDRQRGTSNGKENYGWRRMEGRRRHIGTKPRGHDGPVLDHRHADGYCSIIGGYRYRGSAIADLDGAYLYGDFCKGQIRAFDPSAPRATDRSLGESVSQFSSFGRDNDGELYVLSLSGDVSKIVPEAP